MRKTVHPRLNAGRVRAGHYASSEIDGNNGAFHIIGPNGAALTIIASDATNDPGRDDTQGWEHVSVSLPNRCPNWPEMCAVKALFWEPEETVVQFHPPESSYISNHPHCLHLWRDSRRGHALPPSILVGLKSAGELRNAAEAEEARTAILRDNP